MGVGLLGAMKGGEMAVLSGEDLKGLKVFGPKNGRKVYNNSKVTI